MKRLITSVFFACVCVGSVFAESPKEQSQDPKVVETLKQIEVDYAEATKNSDADKVSEIMADDWSCFGYKEDRMLTKAKIVGDVRTGKYKIESYEYGPMYVKVLGDVGVVQGIFSEKFVYDGAEDTGKFTFLDVYAKRGDKWVLVRSQTGAIEDSPDVASVKQVELSMGNAMIAGDIGKLGQVYGDDFATLGSGGKVTTKKDLLSDFESFHDKLEWYENGPMDVQVFGNVALAQGSVKERRSRERKDTGGQFLWQDLLKKREGKWVVVQSAAGRVVLGESPKEQSQDPTVATIKQFEHAVGDAMLARDTDKLNQTYGDDWATIGSDGKIFTKETLLSDFKTGKNNLVSFETGPMDVQVLGDVAVVQTSVTEKRIRDGKDISGQFVFMDLLKKRAGKWVIVRTLAARVS